MTVEDVGERGLIELFHTLIDSFPRAVLPYGDDAVGIPFGNDVLIINTDMLVGKTDVPPGMTYWQVGRKAAVMNVSDVVAKGAKPMGGVFSLGFPRGTTRDEAADLVKGLNAGCREYGFYYLGGDTNECSDLVVSGAVFGIVGRNKVVSRSGAQPGDVVAVTGHFGLTTMGFKILLEKLSADPKTKELGLRAIYEPHARLKEGIVLSERGLVSSSIDSSDGLAWSLYEISQMSGVGFIIDSIPVPKEVQMFANEHGLNYFDLALYGGEEFELIVTIPSVKWNKAVDAVKVVGGNLYPIGIVTEEKNMVLRLPNQTERRISPKGFEHFKR
ncbi:MAG: thiamine-phosphate kinase [Candidatus Freyarchaeota archaeon]|nr:thiamine-phosphate kinase [Candidatus Jordarchaeia archaeon]MBS7269817.1 thiamine-phosphate kinase [Candidatus Jordarchaeia archaeon]MBS7280549.1 thiamine-phosphate kinase [Candidatus Jordarchaeia archaeon]